MCAVHNSLVDITKQPHSMKLSCCTRDGSRKLNEGGFGCMNAMPTCLRMRRYPGIISSAQHTAAPPAHRIMVKAHMSRQKSENDVFKCILSFERGGPDPLDPPPLYPPLYTNMCFFTDSCLSLPRQQTNLKQNT